MKLFFHYCSSGFSNSYLVGSDSDPKEALVVDPGCMDEQLLEFIEGNDYVVRAVLITHDHANHVRGLRTLLRIYDAEVYAGNPMVADQRATIVKDEEILELGGFKVQAYSVPGHSADSLAYRVGKVLFTGDAISAGLIGSTASSYGKSILYDAISKKILSQRGDMVILPGHGPPTTVEAERRFNAGMEAQRRAALQRAIARESL